MPYKPTGNPPGRPRNDAMTAKPALSAEPPVKKTARERERQKKRRVGAGPISAAFISQPTGLFQKRRPVERPRLTLVRGPVG